ncbi:Panacea domain-containing protein [Aquimarina agarilytica]|uniref:Panacea domain-containing protein n=1 Tax=Aquimarina agarilytica TaxID=1087449 RepID=UPI00028A2074|nr:Panacea domain-containing protein [Aquimarina agarilytica]
MSFDTFSNTRGFSKEEIEKLGNTIIYLCEKMNGLQKTQCLKLIYLLDEMSIKKYGLPFLNLNYEVWKYGPVAQEVFIELSEPKILRDFIELEHDSFNQYSFVNVKAKKEFNDDEFSDNDMLILDYVVKNFSDKNGTELVDFTHAPSSIWYKTAEENGVLELFKKGLKNSTNLMIDFSRLLDLDKKKIFNDFIENRNMLKAYDF